MNDDCDQKDNDIILETSLQTFFYEQLNEFNQKSLTPLPNETIFYSSMVMDKFGNSGQYFEENEGRLTEKILGIKLLKASQLPRNQRKRVIKDVADTALILCGYFADSLNNKIVDSSYYEELGKTAYCRLDRFFPEVYKIPSFFNLFAKRFDDIVTMMNLVSKRFEGDSDQAFLIVKDRKNKVS